MKKIMFVLVVLTLIAYPVTVFADDGITNNPNHFELDMHCQDSIIHVVVPNYYGLTPGFTDDGRIAHPVTHKIDTDYPINGYFDDEWDIVFLLSQGRKLDTVLCTWTWENDEYLHGMDVWFSSDK